MSKRHQVSSEDFVGMYQWAFDEYVKLCKAHYLFNDIR